MANPIYELYEKEVAKNERLSKKYEKVKIELDSIKAENKRLQKKVDEIDEYIERSITKAVNKITEQFEEKIQRLEEQIQMKDAEIDRLRNHINKNSTNSSKPSSTDIVSVKTEKSSANQYNYRIRTYRKSGGQFGHKDHCLRKRKIESVVYKAKAEKLRRRLLKYKESQLLYIRDYNIPFDNNLIERDLRMIKNKTKISGGFRTVEGAKEFASSMSVIKTSIKRK